MSKKYDDTRDRHILISKRMQFLRSLAAKLDQNIMSMGTTNPELRLDLNILHEGLEVIIRDVYENNQHLLNDYMTKPMCEPKDATSESFS